MNSIAHAPVLSSSTSNPAQLLTEAEQADFGEVFAAAIDITRREGRLSIGSLRHHLGVGYCRAIRIGDALERLGFVPPQIRPRRRARFQPIAA